jgi:hypothetical protein
MRPKSGDLNSGLNPARVAGENNMDILIRNLKSKAFLLNLKIRFNRFELQRKCYSFFIIHIRTV